MHTDYGFGLNLNYKFANANIFYLQGICSGYKRVLNKIWMVAAFAKLHYHVVQGYVDYKVIWDHFACFICKTSKIWIFGMLFNQQA